MINVWDAALPTLPFVVGFGVIALAIIIVVIALKGYALWHAARRGEKWWFIVLLVVNTMGILELIYLYFIVGKWHSFKENSIPPSTPTVDSGLPQ